jgi:hypothetical protein
LPAVAHGAAILHAMPKPKADVPANPFADEREMWGELPKKEPGDQFS